VPSILIPYQIGPQIAELRPKEKACEQTTDPLRLRYEILHCFHVSLVGV